jgi:beta-lactamase regulating signal transducer with metallopeptidase domain
MMSSLMPLLIECGFRASLPVGMAWGATRLASRSSAATRHFIWACAIAIALLLPLTTMVKPRWNVAAPAPIARLASVTGADNGPGATPGVLATSRIAVSPTRTPNNRLQVGLTPWMIATWIWMAGAVAVLCYVLMGHFAAWRVYRTTRRVEDSWIQDADQVRRQAGLGRALCIVQSAAVSVPVVLHLWQPIIVMPEATGRWSRERIRAILLHELAHIKRHDSHIRILAQVACVVYWFNPLIWFAAHQLVLERERACDDFVLLSGTSEADYATHLFEVARAASASTVVPFAIGLAENRSQLEKRLIAIVNPQTPRHSTRIFAKLIIVFPMLLVALAAGAVQIAARAIKVPGAAIEIPAPVTQVDMDPAELLTDGRSMKMRSMPTESNGERNSVRREFLWAAAMHEHQTVEVHLGRGSIHVLPSVDDTVRVEARTDNSRDGEIQVVSTADGVKFCNIVTRARKSLNYCDPNQYTGRIQEDQPSTDFHISIPAGLPFAGATVLGDITTKHLRSDGVMATVNGNITLELTAEEGANFNGNVVAGSIDSDFPLNDNTPTFLNGQRPMKAPRIVRGIVGTGGPHLTATVVTGNIRLIRGSTE